MQKDALPEMSSPDDRSTPGDGAQDQQEPCFQNHDDPHMNTCVHCASFSHAHVVDLSMHHVNCASRMGTPRTRVGGVRTSLTW